MVKIERGGQAKHALLCGIWTLCFLARSTEGGKQTEANKQVKAAGEQRSYYGVSAVKPVVLVDMLSRNELERRLHLVFVTIYYCRSARFETNFH